MATNRSRKREPLCETGAASLTDVQLESMLDDVRARAAHAIDGDASALEAAIADLECEAARRGLELVSDVQEETPAPLAFHLFLQAFAKCDRDLAHRALRWIDGGAVFVAWRRIREHGDRSFRIFCLARILFKLDLGLLSFEDAVARQDKLDRCGLPDEDLEAFVEQCIASMFAVAFSGPQRGGNR